MHESPQGDSQRQGSEQFRLYINACLESYREGGDLNQSMQFNVDHALVLAQRITDTTSPRAFTRARESLIGELEQAGLPTYTDRNSLLNGFRIMTETFAQGAFGVEYKNKLITIRRRQETPGPQRLLFYIGERVAGRKAYNTACNVMQTEYDTTMRAIHEQTHTNEGEAIEPITYRAELHLEHPFTHEDEAGERLESDLAERISTQWAESDRTTTLKPRNTSSYGPGHISRDVEYPLAPGGRVLYYSQGMSRKEAADLEYRQMQIDKAGFMTIHLTAQPIAMEGSTPDQAAPQMLRPPDQDANYSITITAKQGFRQQRLVAETILAMFTETPVMREKFMPDTLS